VHVANFSTSYFVQTDLASFIYPHSYVCTSAHGTMNYFRNESCAHVGWYLFLFNKLYGQLAIDARTLANNRSQQSIVNLTGHYASSRSCLSFLATSQRFL